jgi:hypothetical protein
MQMCFANSQMSYYKGYVKKKPWKNMSKWQMLEMYGVESFTEGDIGPLVGALLREIPKRQSERILKSFPRSIDGSRIRKHGNKRTIPTHSQSCPNSKAQFRDVSVLAKSHALSKTGKPHPLLSSPKTLEQRGLPAGVFSPLNPPERGHSLSDLL